jgi:hypothetical protein
MHSADEGGAMSGRGESVDDPAQNGAHVPHIQFLDEREARPVNPNTPEGEIRNMAAFAAGAHATTPGRRLAIQVVVWLVLLGIALAIVAGIVTGIRTF